MFERVCVLNLYSTTQMVPLEMQQATSYTSNKNRKEQINYNILVVPTP